MSDKIIVRRHRALGIAFMAPALAWGALIVAGDMLDENLCSTGAAPNRGSWFDIDVRWVLLALASGALLVALVAALFLARLHRRAEADGDLGSSLVTSLGLLSLLVFVPAILATGVWLIMNRNCS